MINLHNKDCMEALKEFKDNHFNLAIIDPPYGIGENGNKGIDRVKCNRNIKYKNIKSKLTNYTKKEWDNKTATKEYFTELKRASKNQIIFGANHFIENIPKANSSCWIVWDKDNSGDFADCELAYTSFLTAVRKIKWRWNGMFQQNMKK